MDEIIDFFPRVLENIKEEISNGVTWDNLIKIPGLEDNINLAEKGINEDLNNYKEEILEKQKEKDEVITRKKMKRKKKILNYIYQIIEILL